MTQENTDIKVIKGGLLIDSNGGPPIEEGAVIISGSTIKWVGPSKDIAFPEGLKPTVFEFPGKTIMPGLVDVHTHMNMPGDGSSPEEVYANHNVFILLQSVKNAASHLESGVTTARDNGAKDRTSFSLKEGIENGFVNGPRMLLSGRPITVTGGHCWMMGGEADGVEGVRAAVRQLVKERADFIKVMVNGGGTENTFPYLPAFNDDELNALAWESHKFNKPVAAHCQATAGINSALEAGADMIIHCTYFQPDGTYKFDQTVAEKIVKKEAWVNLTLHVGLSRIFLLEAIQRTRKLTAEEQERLDAGMRRRDIHHDACNRMIELGVKFAAGSDSGWGNYPLGEFQREVEALTSLGMSNHQGIISATKDAAASTGVSDLVGTLEEGKEADVLILDGNPIQDIKNLSKVAAVFKSGLRVK